MDNTNKQTEIRSSNDLTSSSISRTSASNIDESWDKLMSKVASTNLITTHTPLTNFLKQPNPPSLEPRQNLLYECSSCRGWFEESDITVLAKDDKGGTASFCISCRSIRQSPIPTYPHPTINPLHSYQSQFFFQPFSSPEPYPTVTAQHAQPHMWSPLHPQYAPLPTPIPQTQSVPNVQPDNSLEDRPDVLVQPAKYQISNYNVHPPVAIAILPGDVTAPTMAFASLVEASNNIELLDGFQAGASRLVEVGTTILYFTGLKLNKMTKIKKELQKRGVLRGETYSIRIRIGESKLVETNTFDMVSSGTQLPISVRQQVRPSRNGQGAEMFKET